MHEHDGIKKPIHLASEEGDALSDETNDVEERVEVPQGDYELPVKTESVFDAEEERVVLNVGGVRHETHVATLLKIDRTRLSRLAEQHLISARDVYFFDRHPAVFNSVIDFYRTGKRRFGLV
ncbi:hypothetical protein DPMN_091709 [Dreissena polymorpha]|uniref:Potassium channel tetramerisation-type BTB domain-containing protein n=1 Tax=Dreissena polymorpha TaxID=45954 RepID=A0A9D4L0N3_DREPO|nr:hypothetical protein DPMN_091709 [Dreissena polymorpha]